MGIAPVSGALAGVVLALLVALRWRRRSMRGGSVLAVALLLLVTPGCSDTGGSTSTAAKARGGSAGRSSTAGRTGVLESAGAPGGAGQTSKGGMATGGNAAGVGPSSAGGAGQAGVNPGGSAGQAGVNPGGSAGQAGAGGSGGAPGTKVKVALQGYSVRNYLGSDFKGTLQKLKDMGYDGIEFPGDGFQGDPAQVKTWLDSIGFQAVANHWWSNDIKGVNGPASWSLAVGASVVVLRWPDGDTEGMLKDAAPKFKAQGLSLSYHNHDFDVWTLDKMLGDIPDLNAELDTAWANLGGYGAVKFFQKWKGRIPTCHLKDYDNNKNMKPLGQGTQDIKSICKAAVDAGVKWLIYEDESGTDGLQSAKIGRDYLHGIGY